MTDTRLDLPGQAATFPRLPDPHITRDAYLTVLASTVFEGNTDLAIITGEEGCGKTTVLSQFALAHSTNCISLFVRGTSPAAHDPGFAARDITNQINCALGRFDATVGDRSGGALIRSVLFDLDRQAQRGNIYFYFLIDGLHEVDDEAVVAQLLSYLPLGLPRFRCIISDRDARVQGQLKPQLRLKELSLLSLSRTEVQHLLEDLTLDDAELEDLWKITLGNPGRVMQARRLLQGGQSTRHVLENGLFETEWARLEAGASWLVELYGLVAFDRREANGTSLARVLSIDSKAIVDEITKSSMLEDHDGRVRFRTHALRDQVARKLDGRAPALRERILADLVESGGPDALMCLPETYFDAERFDEVLDSLAPKTFQEIVARSDSMAGLERFVEYGRSAAERTAREAESVRFAMDRSMLREVSHLRIWSSEMEAYLAHDEYDRALALAQSAAIDEERVLLLSRFAARKLRSGDVVEPEIEAQIRRTYERLNMTMDADEALDIASELVHVCPDLAVDLVERIGGAGDGPNALDAALAFLTISAAAGGYERSDKVESQVTSRIEDRRMRQMAQAFSSVVRNRSAGDVLAQVKTVESVSGRLYMLRSWIRFHRKSPDAARVVTYALNTAVRTPDYSPNAQVARDLALPLPFIEDVSTLSDIMRLLDVQLPSLRKLGPMSDSIELQLLMAESVAQSDQDSAQERILNVFIETLDYPDIIVRCRGLAQIAASQDKLQGVLGDPLGLRAEVRSELAPLLSNLLESSAEHFVLTKPILAAFAEVDLERAVRLARALNTRARRDQALSLVVQHAARSTSVQPDWKRLAEISGDISSGRLRDRTVRETIAEIARDPDGCSLEAVLPVLRQSAGIRESVYRCKALADAILVACTIGDRTSGDVEAWRSALRETWEEIDRPWTKVDVAYGLARDLAGPLRDEAERYLSEGESLRAESILDTPGAAASFHTAMRIVLRGFSGLVAAGDDDRSDHDRLVELICREESIGERSRLMAELALVYYAADRRDLAHEVCETHLRVLVSTFPESDTAYRDHVLQDVVVPLYLDHATSALELVESMDRDYRDNALTNLVHFKLTRQAPWDAYHADEGRSDRIKETDLRDVCDLLQHFRSDDAAYAVIKRLEATVTSVRGKRHFNDRVRLSIADRLASATSEIFPMDGQIAHDGYRIASRGSVLRIREEAKDRQRREWGELINEIEEIPNLADRVMVSAWVLEKTPHRIRRDRQDSWVSALKRDALALPLAADRGSRLQGVAEALGGFDKQAAKEVFRLALARTRPSNDEEDEREVWSRYRRILDAAQDLDEDLAASLASLSEEEEGLQKYGQQVQRHMQESQARRFLANPDGPEGTGPPGREDLPGAAWGALASLNAGRGQTLGIETVLPWLADASEIPMSEAYPAFSLVIQHLCQSLSADQVGAGRLRSIFERTLESSEIAHYLLARAKNQSAFPARREDPEGDDSSVITIAPRQADKVQGVLTSWFARNARDYLKIVDPYFGPDELIILQALLDSSVVVDVRILTGRRRQGQVVGDLPIQDAYREAWRRFFDVAPPVIDVTIVEAVIGRQPLHDRVVLTNGAGLQFGTSVNSLGGRVESSITRLGRGAASDLEAQYNQYFDRVRRPNEETELKYFTFDI